MNFHNSAVCLIIATEYYELAQTKRARGDTVHCGAEIRCGGVPSGACDQRHHH